MHQFRIVDGSADAHCQNIGDGLYPHLPFQNPGPVLKGARDFQGIVCECFIGAAGSGFGGPTQQTVDQEDRQQQSRIFTRHDTQQSDFDDHEYGADHQQPPTAEDVGQRARWHLEQHDGRSPGGIQQRELVEGQAEIEN